MDELNRSRRPDRGGPTSAEHDADQEPVNLVRERALTRRKVDRKASGAEGPARIPENGGEPLGSDVRARMEPRLGANLSGVKVHTGGDSAKAAGDLGARAFTVGSSVHFNRGEFAPGSKEGDRLIAHELTHVVQGQKSGVQRKADDGEAGGHGHEVSQPGDAAEVEADHVADHVTDDLHGAHGKENGKAHGKDKPAGSDGKRVAGAPDKGHDKKAEAAGAAGHEKAPAIGAKLQGIARSSLAGKGPPPPAPPAPAAAAKPKSGKEQSAEQWVDANLPTLTAFDAAGAPSFMPIVKFESALKPLLADPALAQNAKVQSAKKTLDGKKRLLGAICNTELIKEVRVPLRALDAHSPKSWAAAKALKDKMRRWDDFFISKSDGEVGYEAVNETLDVYVRVTKQLTKNRDEALKTALEQMGAVKEDDPNATTILDAPYHAAQVWFEGGMPDSSGLVQKVKTSYVDKKHALVAHKEKEQQRQKEAQQHSQKGGGPQAAGPTGGDKKEAKPQGAPGPAVAGHGPPPPAPPPPAPVMQAKAPPPIAAPPQQHDVHPPAHAPAAPQAHVNPPAAPAAMHMATGAGPTGGGGGGATEAHLKQIMNKDLKAEAAKEGKSYETDYDAVKAECEQFRKEILGGYRDLIDGNVEDEVLQEIRAHIHHLKPEEMVAIRGYTSGDYEKLNAVLRNPSSDPVLAAKLKPYIQLTTSGLEKLPDYTGTVYRGSQMTPDWVKKYEHAAQSGTLMSDPAFLSTSYSQTQAEVFRDKDDAEARKAGKVPVLYTIQSKHGKRVEFLSYKAREAEVLFKPGTQFRVLAVDTVGTGKHILMVER